MATYAERQAKLDMHHELRELEIEHMAALAVQLGPLASKRQNTERARAIRTYGLLNDELRAWVAAPSGGLPMAFGPAIRDLRMLDQVIRGNRTYQVPAISITTQQRKA